MLKKVRDSIIKVATLVSLFITILLCYTNLYMQNAKNAYFIRVFIIFIFFYSFLEKFIKTC